MFAVESSCYERQPYDVDGEKTKERGDINLQVVDHLS
jgi:hypothetical protein